MNEGPQRDRQNDTAPAWWSKYRDLFYLSILLVGWGVLYGQLTTRLAQDEAAITQMQGIMNDRMATEKEMISVNGRLDDIGHQLSLIQQQIFQMQEKGGGR